VTAELRVFEFGDFRFDADTPVLWRGGALVPLTPKTLDLLRALVEGGGDVVSKAELMSRVWPDTVVEEGNLTVLVAALRKGIDPRPQGGSFIQTVPRRGYRFDASLTATGATTRRAVAVLPFRILGAGAGADADLGLAVADAVIGRLARHDGLLVLPTLAVTHLGGESRAPQDVARELGVDAVLTGSLQFQGARVRASVQLAAATRAIKFLACTIEADAGDEFALQDVVAAEVERRFAPRLLGEEGASRPSPRTDSRMAYLHGRFFWARFTPRGLGQAFARFGEAAALDPGDAAPYAGLADCHLLLGMAGLSPPVPAWTRTIDCATRALERDPERAEALSTRAFARLFRDHDWGAARRDLDGAVALAPGLASVHFWRGFFRAISGDLAGAREDVAHGHERDALSIVGNAFRCFVHELAGEHAEEEAIARGAVALRPESFLGHRCLGVAQLALGQVEPGLRSLRRAVELTDEGPVMRALLALALARTGAREEARGHLDALDAAAATTSVSACARATVLLALGDVPGALGRIEEGITAREATATFLGVVPAFAALRHDARFQALVARTGFPGRS
jgi:DNA-binding winged helix-turn-helix (wHTH) protein/tetratricopeptide (TPR) repeat protein